MPMIYGFPKAVPGILNGNNGWTFPGPVVVQDAWAIQRPYDALMATLDAEQSAAISILGDSTGNDTGEWPDLVGSWLASRYPGHTVKSMLWNDATQAYSAPTTLQSGAAGERYLQFTGTLGAYLGNLTTLASGVPNITGDIDIRAKIECNWRPAQSVNTIVSQFGDAGSRCGMFYLTNAGQLAWQLWDGTSQVIASSSGVSVVPDDGAARWVRVTHDMDNGSGGNTVKFYTSNDGITWTQLGSNWTTAGTVSYVNSTRVWEIGSRQSGVYPYTGKIYSVNILQGIDGVPIGPQHIDAWQPANDTVTYGGAPVLWIINGSHPGANLAYLGDATRLPKLTPDYGQCLTFVSCSHNESTAFGPYEMTRYGTFLTNVSSRYPLSQITIILQNPRIAPAVSIHQHNIRRLNLIAWSRKNGYSVLDVYKAFMDNSQGLAALISGSDGVHLLAAGNAVWADCVKKALSGSL